MGKVLDFGLRSMTPEQRKYRLETAKTIIQERIRLAMKQEVQYGNDPFLADLICLDVKSQLVLLDLIEQYE